MLRGFETRAGCRRQIEKDATCLMLLYFGVGQVSDTHTHTHTHTREHTHTYAQTHAHTQSRTHLLMRDSYDFKVTLQIFGLVIWIAVRIKWPRRCFPTTTPWTSQISCKTRAHTRTAGFRWQQDWHNIVQQNRQTRVGT
jgi:hypothetical protein